MFKKKYTDSELTDRINLFWVELEKQCNELDSDEFEFYYEIWGVLWMPWFIVINNQSLTFTANDISESDLMILVEKGKIEVIKEYDKSEMKDEFDRKRYRIIKNHS